jgi:hypothetical protein
VAKNCVILDFSQQNNIFNTARERYVWGIEYLLNEVIEYEAAHKKLQFQGLKLSSYTHNNAVPVRA